MEDTFVEFIVKRKVSFSAIGIRVGCIFAVIACLFLSIVIGMVGLTLAALGIYLTYMAWQMTSVEYEYSLLNNEITVVKIMGQRKRKKLMDIDLKLAEIIADADSEEILKRINSNMKVVDYSSGTPGNLKYAIILNDASGVMEIIFEPNEKMINSIHRVRPSVVRIATN